MTRASPRPRPRARLRLPRWLVRLSASTEEGTAAGIYGVVVGAAVMASSHATTARSIIAAVLVTLVVYWGAERYSRLVAERIHEGRRPTLRQTRQTVTTGWEMVTASAAPLAVLVMVRVLGASLNAAVVWALACSTVLLFLAGWEVGRKGPLSRAERLVSAVVAATFGAIMIVFKGLLH